MAHTKVSGADLRDADAEKRRQAAAQMGSARTPAKRATAAANIGRLNEERRANGWSEETKAKLKAAQQARREREQAEKAALAADKQLPLPIVEEAEKRGPGRPRKAVEEPIGAKRGRGRPRKAAEGVVA